MEEGNIETLKRLKMQEKKKRIETRHGAKTPSHDLSRNQDEDAAFDKQKVSKDTSSVNPTSALNFKRPTREVD